MDINWRVKAPVAVKVVAVYLIIVALSLVLAGLLTSAVIRNYVLGTTQADLTQGAYQIIKVYRENERRSQGGQGAPRDHVTKVSAAGSLQPIPVIAQGVPVEYVVLDSTGGLIGGRFPARDAELLRATGNVLLRALEGRIQKGAYPNINPVFQYVAIPFMQKSTAPPVAPPDVVRVPRGISIHETTHVVALFARVSDLRRISGQIWRAVLRGLLIASIVTAIVGFFLARRLMRPIDVMRQAVERVRQRDFSNLPVVRTGDEWEDFATVFGDMVVALRTFDEGQKRFLQNASHELKTPLMAIRGYAEGLRDGVFEPSESFRILDIVAQESVRLKQLVDDLIYLSKLETLDELYAFATYDLASIIYKTVERVRPLARDRSVQVRVQASGRPFWASVDPDKMVQALLNLLSNGVRHTRTQVEVALWREGPALYLTVADDGEGFEPGDAERVFERFYHGTRGDTGLGLSIAKAIVEKHRGEIGAGNRPGGGALIRISLPATDRQVFM